jgi:hypothetical protein
MLVFVENKGSVERIPSIKDRGRSEGVGWIIAAGSYSQRTWYDSVIPFKFMVYIKRNNKKTFLTMRKV